MVGFFLASLTPSTRGHLIEKPSSQQCPKHAEFFLSCFALLNLPLLYNPTTKRCRKGAQQVQPPFGVALTGLTNPTLFQESVALK